LHLNCHFPAKFHAHTSFKGLFRCVVLWNSP
jgi:hypothetical protein